MVSIATAAFMAVGSNDNASSPETVAQTDSGTTVTANDQTGLAEDLVVTVPLSETANQAFSEYPEAWRVHLRAMDESIIAGGNIPDELWENKAFVLAAVQENGWALEYASAELRNDTEIVLVAVQEEGAAFSFASEELRNDRAFVLAVLQENGAAFVFASAELRANEELQRIALDQINNRLSATDETDMRAAQPSAVEADTQEGSRWGWIPFLGFHPKGP